MREDKEIEEEIEYIMHSFVEQGIYEYFNDEKGKLCLRKGKNFDKRKELPLPKTVAGKKIEWT